MLVVALTLAAPVLGATNLLWPKAAVILGAALVWWMSPPSRPQPWQFNTLLAALALMGFVALLPRAWFPAAPWSAPLQQLGVTLPSTFSPQPWLTLEKALLLTGGVAWAWYLVSRNWYVERRVLLGLYAGGVLAIAIVSLAAFATGRSFITITGIRIFGVFPNRNQMANFLALGCLIMLALAIHDGMRRHRAAWFWFGGCAVTLAGLPLTGSRAGVLLFAVGTVAWLAWMSRVMHRRRWLAMSLSGLLLLTAALFLFGTPLLSRLRSLATLQTEEAGGSRTLVYLDAARLLKEASWHGVGLGNFEPLFANYRRASVNRYRALHPESDWLWLGIEGGWFAPVLALAALVLIVRQCWPFAKGSDRVLRSAALVCVLLFVAHGLVDVSGHRIGTLWPALFLLGMAANADWTARRDAVRIGRLGAVPLAAIGVVLLLSVLRVTTLPTSATLARLKAGINTALEQKKFGDVLQRANDALRIAPLDWELYFARATARAMTSPATGPAAADFAIARHLEPNPSVAFEEGKIWLGRDAEYVEKSFFLGREPERAAAAWRGLIERHPVDAPEFFEQMMYIAQGYPEMMPHLRSIADRQPRLLLGFLFLCSGAEFDSALQTLLTVDPGLKFASPDQLRRLFRSWAQGGDPAALEQTLAAHPVWLESGWVALGEVREQRGDFEGACALARQFVGRASLPAVPGSKDLAGARADFIARPRDLVAGVLYLQRLLDHGAREEALRIVRNLTALPGAPAYLHALEADLCFDQRDFQRAWAAWKRSTAPG